MSLNTLRTKQNKPYVSPTSVLVALVWRLRGSLALLPPAQSSLTQPTGARVARVPVDTFRNGCNRFGACSRITATNLSIVSAVDMELSGTPVQIPGIMSNLLVLSARRFERKDCAQHGCVTYTCAPRSDDGDHFAFHHREPAGKHAEAQAALQNCSWKI